MKLKQLIESKQKIEIIDDKSGGDYSIIINNIKFFEGHSSELTDIIPKLLKKLGFSVSYKRE